MVSYLLVLSRCEEVQPPHHTLIIISALFIELLYEKSNNTSKLVTVHNFNPHLSEHKVLVEGLMILCTPLSYLSTTAISYKLNYFSGFLSHISPESTAITTIHFPCFSYAVRL